MQNICDEDKANLFYTMQPATDISTNGKGRKLKQTKFPNTPDISEDNFSMRKSSQLYKIFKMNVIKIYLYSMCVDNISDVSGIIDYFYTFCYCAISKEVVSSILIRAS